MGFREVVPSRERRSITNRIIAIQRHNPNQDVTELRRKLGFLMVSDAVQHVLDKFPPFNEDQERDLIRLLRSGRASSASHGEAA